MSGPGELRAAQPLDGPVGSGNFRVGVTDGLDLSWLLGKEHGSTPGEGLNVGLVGRQHRGQPAGETLFARWRAPNGLLQLVPAAQGQHFVGSRHRLGEG
jgi:hypothetical protein